MAKNKNNVFAEFVDAAEKDAGKIVKHFVKKNKISPEKGKRILKKFLNDTKPVRKQIAKIAKETISGKVRQTREILRLLDKGMLFLQKELGKIK